MLRGASYWHRRTNLYFVIFVGITALVGFLAAFWRSWSRSESANRMTIGLIAFLILAICFFCVKHVRELDKLNGQVNAETLDRLSRYASAMGFLGCSVLLLAVALLRLR
jgi:MFS-type transporter involved in bile tolerance (Atg22 family)